MLFSWQCVRNMLRIRVMDTFKTVQAGRPAYDGDVVGLDGVTGRLLHFQRPPRPLVVIFGSCT